MSRNPIDFSFKPINLGLGSSSSKPRKRTLGRNDREILHHNAKGKCEACGKKIDLSEMQVGHKRAFSKGGATTPANSACLCYRCNKWQGTGTLVALKKKLADTYGKKVKSTAKRTTKKKTTRKKSSRSSDSLGFKPIKFSGFKL